MKTHACNGMVAVGVNGMGRPWARQCEYRLLMAADGSYYEQVCRDGVWGLFPDDYGIPDYVFEVLYVGLHELLRTMP